MDKRAKGKNGGDDGDRTHDPFHAMEVLSQLSYVPTSTFAQRTTREEILYKKSKKTSQTEKGPVLKTFPQLIFSNQPEAKWWAKQDLNL